MNFHLSQSFQFDAAHTLSRIVPLEDYASSRRIHGHTYTASVTVRGARDERGMVSFKRGKRTVSVDLYYLRQVIADCRSHLDHRLLDDVEGLGAATMENLCVFIANRIGLHFPVYSVEVGRLSGDKCIYYVDEKGCA